MNLLLSSSVYQLFKKKKYFLCYCCLKLNKIELLLSYEKSCVITIIIEHLVMIELTALAVVDKNSC